MFSEHSLPEFPDHTHLAKLAFATNPSDGERLIIKSNLYYLVVTYRASSRDYLVGTRLKVEGGIKELIAPYDSFDVDHILTDAHTRIESVPVSPRPFVLGQGCDGTTDNCCHALFYAFCMAHRLDPYQLYRQAYEKHDGKRYSPPRFEEWRERAEWEGVSYPEQWGPEEIRALLKSLYSINNRSLVEVVEETPPYVAIPEEVRATWMGDY